MLTWNEPLYYSPEADENENAAVLHSTKMFVEHIFVAK